MSTETVKMLDQFRSPSVRKVPSYRRKDPAAETNFLGFARSQLEEIGGERSQSLTTACFV